MCWCLKYNAYLAYLWGKYYLLVICKVFHRYFVLFSIWTRFWAFVIWRRSGERLLRNSKSVSSVVSDWNPFLEVINDTFLQWITFLAFCSRNLIASFGGYQGFICSGFFNYIIIFRIFMLQFEFRRLCFGNFFVNRRRCFFICVYKRLNTTFLLSRFSKRCENS